MKGISCRVPTSPRTCQELRRSRDLLPPLPHACSQRASTGLCGWRGRWGFVLMSAARKSWGISLFCFVVVVCVCGFVGGGCLFVLLCLFVCFSPPFVVVVFVCLSGTGLKKCFASPHLTVLFPLCVKLQLSSYCF